MHIRSKNILTGGSYVHLYYIFILVQLILLSELFCRAVERHPAVTLLLSAGLTFGMEIVLYLLTVGQLQWQFPVAPIGLFVCWPLFYNIGAWLAKSGLSDCLRLRVCLPLWGAFGGAGAAGGRAFCGSPIKWVCGLTQRFTRC